MGSDLWVLMTVCQIPFEDFEETNLILAGSVVQSNTSLRSPEVELPIFPLAWFWYTSIHAQCFCYKNQLQIYRYTPNPNPSKHHIRMQHDLFAAWSISHARIWTYTDSGSTQAWRKSHQLCVLSSHPKPNSQKDFQTINRHHRHNHHHDIQEVGI